MPDTVSLIGQALRNHGLTEVHDDWNRVTPGRLRPGDVATLQRADLPLLVEHDPGWRVGTVRYAERSGLGLMLACTGGPNLADVLDDGHDDDMPWYLSVRYRAAPLSTLADTSARLTEVSLVKRPGAVGVSPLVWSRIDIADTDEGQPKVMPLPWRTVWSRAHGVLAAPSSRRASHLVVLDVDRVETAAHLRAHPPAPTPAPAPGARRRTYAEVAAAAAELGVNGFTFDDDHGEERRIWSGGGHIVSFAH